MSTPIRPMVSTSKAVRLLLGSAMHPRSQSSGFHNGTALPTSGQYFVRTTYHLVLRARTWQRRVGRRPRRRPGSFVQHLRMSSHIDKSSRLSPIVSAADTWYYEDSPDPRGRDETGVCS